MSEDLKDLIDYLLMLLCVIIVFLLSLLSLSSCASKKNTASQQKEIRVDTIKVVETKTDTVFSEKTIEKTKPVYYETIVEKPCDSLGNLKPINTKIGSGTNETTIFSKDGKLYISAKIDSTENALQKEYKSRWRQDSVNLREKILKETATTSKTTKTVWPWWLWAALIVGGISLLLNIYQKIKPL